MPSGFSVVDHERKEPFDALRDVHLIHSQGTVHRTTAPPKRKTAAPKPGNGDLDETLTDRIQLPEVQGWSKAVMVELRGIEPRTSCMPCKRSTN
jgi:hypothetical protein